MARFGHWPLLAKAVPAPMDTEVIVLNTTVPTYGDSGAQRRPFVGVPPPLTSIAPVPSGTLHLGYPMTFWLLTPRSLGGPSRSLLLKGSRPSCLLLLPQGPPHPTPTFSAISPSCTPFLDAELLRTHSWHFPGELESSTDLPARVCPCRSPPRPQRQCGPLSPVATTLLPSLPRPLRTTSSARDGSN